MYGKESRQALFEALQTISDPVDPRTPTDSEQSRHKRKKTHFINAFFIPPNYSNKSLQLSFSRSKPKLSLN